MAVDDDILEFMKQHGPLLPADIGRHIKTNIIFASAYLSELSSRGKVKISALKVGGSPVYYLPEHHDRLDKFASNLNEKDLRAYDLLKQKQVLRDTHMTPLVRVALRSIKDFASPVTVTFENKQELFWKWHNASDDDVKKIVQQELGIQPEQKVQETEKIQEIEQEKTQVPELKKTEVTPKVEQKTLTKKTKKIEQKSERIEKKTEQKGEKVEPKTEIKIEKQPQKLEKIEQPELKKKLIQSESIITESENRSNFDFMLQVEQFFKEKEVKTLRQTVVKKGVDIDFMIEIPSPMGKLTYYCKALNKKRPTEKDISSALISSQVHKMPVIFLHGGELSKKAQELVKTEPFKMMTLYQLNH